MANVSQEQLLCSICLNVFSAPVTTPCGHNFCRACIMQYWDRNDIIICPVCKKDFGTRPEMSVNTVLDGMAFALKNKPQVNNTGSPMWQPQMAPAGHVSYPMSAPGEMGYVGLAPTGGVGYVAPSAVGGVGYVNMATPVAISYINVNCDECLDVRAVKSCNICMKSFCDLHLQSHHTSSCLRCHPLIDPYPYLPAHRRTRNMAFTFFLMCVAGTVLFAIIHSVASTFRH